MKLFISTITFILLTLLTGFVLRSLFVDNKKEIAFDVNFLLKQALFTDYNKRAKSEGFTNYSYPITHDWPKKKIVFTTEKGERVQTNIDSIRSLPIEEKIRIIRETHLLETHPIAPDSLNACFQEVLEQKNIHTFTGIRYTYIGVNSTKSEYSGTDSTFFASAYPLKEYTTGIFNEIVIQAYVKIPLTTVIDRAGMPLAIPCLIWLVVFVAYIVYLYKIIKRKREESKLSEADRIREMLQLDTQNTCLYYKDQKIELTPTFVQILALFMDKPDFFISKEEISNSLGDNPNGQNNRIAQAINRLRKCLAVIPELQIKTVRGMGYKIVLEK